jgi:phospholipid/cholesterol/gamma-HCH transport system substrate-binding protein
VTPAEGAVSPQVARVRRGRGFSRIAGIAALILIAVAIIVLLLSSGGNSNHYKLLFETGGQLVKGNQVMIGGVPVGSVDDVKLIDSGQAEVDISVDRRLHDGTSAIIRATSLSGIANRYVSLQPGPDNAPELRQNETITEVDTTSPVDLDQLFNTLREPERQALRNIIQGSATVYAGKGPEANRTYKYLSPSLVATDRVLQELSRDEGTLTNFLVNGASVLSAVAERRTDLSALTQNANRALGAIAAQNRSFDRALVALPGGLRQANTTFHNLRPALDDLDRLVNVSKPATKNLAPFLRQLTPVVKKSVPVFHDLGRAVNRRGKANDLADAAGDLGPLEARASTALPATVAAMQRSDHVLRFLRPYSPDIFSAISGLDRAAGYYDANGHYLRSVPAGMSIFRYTGGAPPNLDPIPVSETLSPVDYGGFGSPNHRVFHRCPGGASQPQPDGSNPFLDMGMLIPGPPFPPGDCDPADVVPGP